MRFTTINSNLFAKPKEADIPDWMKDINTDVSNPSMDLEFDKIASWAEKQKVNRDTRDYQPKTLTAKLNDNEILYAKTELAKFLKDKHYTIKTASVDNDIVTLTTTISNTPGEFNFMFDKSNNKIKLAKTFNYNNEFYPFNQAGFKECISEIDIHNPIAQKVDADKASIISTEEIYRRYNGHIRQATDRINELLKEGSIVGVTSNSFGTFLDVNYLFPQQEKEQLSDTAPQFEFVANIEKTKVTEAKSSYQLAMEASKLFEQNYDDFKINNYKRKDNILYIQASVLKDNITKDVNLKFDIVDEKVQNRSMPKISSKNITNDKQNKIYNNNIIKRQHLASFLTHNGYFVDVDDVLTQLLDKKYIQQIASDKYTSKYSLNQLLNTIQLKQDKKKLNKITDKVVDLRLNREAITDTGVREAEELVSEQTLLNAVNEFLIKHFDTYEVITYNIYEAQDNTTNMNVSVNAFNNNNGLTVNINFNFVFNYNTIVNYDVTVNGQNTTIEQIQDAYDINEALVNYLDEKTAKRVKSNIIFTKQSFIHTASKIAKIDNIDKTLQLLEKQDKIQKISNDKYASKFTLEQLINISNLQALSKNTIRNNIIKSQLNKTRLSGIYTQDTLERDIIDVWSDNEVEIYINNLISKVFTTFNIENITKSDIYNVAINAVDEDGVTKPMTVKIDCYNNHPNEIIEIIKPTSDKSVKEYLIFNKPNLYNAKGILTQKQLEDSLLDVVDINEIDSIVKLLVDNVIIEPLFDGKYKLNNTMSQVVAFLNKKKKTNITANKERRDKAIRQAQTTDSITVMDNDTREVDYAMSDEEIYYYVLDKLSTQFDYIDDINDIIENDDSWTVNFVAIDNDGIMKEISALFSKAGDNPEDLLEITKDGTSEIVQEYIDIYAPNTYNLQGIISKNQLANILNDFVEGINIQDCLELLLDNDIIEIVANNKFKTKTTLASAIDFLGNKGIISKRKIQAKKEQRKQAIRIAQETDAPNTFDNDTRTMVNTMTDEEIKLYLSSKLDTLFKNFTVGLYQVLEDDNTYEVEITAIDIDGVEKPMLVYFDMDKFGNPENIIRIVKPRPVEEVEEYLNYEKANQEGHLGCMTYRQLQTKLSPIVKETDFQDILKLLIDEDLIENIGDNQFAIKTTMSYIIQRLKELDKTDIVSHKEELKKATRSEDFTESKPLLETDTRDIVQEEKLSLAGTKAQKNLLKQASDMYDNKQLTLRKFMQVQTMLKQAVNERQLNEVSKILNEYKI